MEDFLSTCHAAVKASAGLPSGPVFHVVLGNEACDLDSMVCALVYAYFLSKTRGDPAGLSVPLLNIRQEELALRSDNTFLLRQTGLSPDSLLFRDQLDLALLRGSGRLRLTLVDHNTLPSSDADLEAAVVEVIDHHALEREPGQSCSVTVETVGSCATLVTERLIQNAPHILDKQVAQLLYATILTDCVNMAPVAGKVTPKDSQYAAALEARFPSMPPRGALYQALHNAKFDLSGLNTEQMLMKDMKTLAGSFSIAVSVLYQPIEAFMQRAELEAELSFFCRKLSFDLLVLMSISFTEAKQPIRELALFSHSAPRREQASRFLERAGNPALDLRPIGSPHRHVAAYHQGNALASRKKLLPLLKDFLRTSDGEDDEDGGRVPPTPMNSLVEGCPLDAGPPPISVDALHDKLGKMDAR
ncbi:exopolyphosphatase PRUNE1 isoform X2 [Syngnathoides biaculeatus]|uniref:exopolyphosphatase PRUNE1 isoform X2 n=1 Tax=Syngnathoides biaculeatus TaxID=300417 RepID=UPI002ADDD94E|nr:exopolyphosphatase PRUNE1 isoform X2 [Syngnathoides biaculeatus]